MYLNQPLEALSTPDQARLLTVLYRAGQPLSGRMIAALTGTVSQSTVSRLLTGLTSTGLVLRVPGGYVINREHLAHRAVENLCESNDEFRRRVGRAIEAWGAQPVAVIVFGSAARGDAEASSDVDLLVIRPAEVDADDEAWAHDVSTLAEHVQLWTGAACDVLEYEPDELEELHRSGDPLVDSLLRDGIPIVGSPLRSLLGAMSG